MNTLPVRWENFSPFSLNLEDTFARIQALQDNQNVSYPPYNIRRLDDDTVALEVALPGILPENVEVSTERSVLQVTAEVAEKEDEGTYLHRGLARRRIQKNWQLSGDSVVTETKLEHGLLTITVTKNLPEAQKRKVFSLSPN